MSRKLLFIINPNAGKKIGAALLPLIEQKVKGVLDYEIAVWQNIDEFNLIANKLHTGGFTDAIAVGGDGTVNMVGKTILKTNISLGIIPVGSGNGLARSLGLPMNSKKAIDAIIEGKVHVVDSGTVNGIPFFCTSGVGFDAHIGNLFASSVKRGLQSYVKIIWSEFASYKAKKYRIKYNGQEVERNAFLITVGNAGQYGNDFYIAPGAKMDDALFHVSVLKPFKVRQVFGLVLKIMRRKADESKLIEAFACNEITIVRPERDVIHFDGEPAMAEETVTFKIIPASLKAITGSEFIGS